MSEDDTLAKRLLAEYICNMCSTGLMEDHPELHDWLKCEACGFCKKKTKE